MRDELKRSLNKVFEHEQLGIKQPITNKRPKKSFLPLIISACLIIVLSVVTYSIIRDNFSDSSTSTSSDKATLDHLQGEYVGNNIAVGEINSTILYAFDINGMELQTKKEPYSVTLNAAEEIPRTMRYKHAIYMFSLIPNVEFIEYKMPDGTEMIEKTKLESMYNIDFSKVKGDEAIMTTYYKTITDMLPQVQTSRDDAYKLLFNALNTNTKQIISDFDTTTAPDVSFSINDQQYVLWLKPEEDVECLYIVDVEKPYQAIIVDGKDYEKLQHFLTSDYELVTGPISEITENQLLITTGEQNDISYLITVDNGADYEVNKIVTVWSTMTTASIPAIAHATKIQRK